MNWKSQFFDLCLCVHVLVILAAGGTTLGASRIFGKFNLRYWSFETQDDLKAARHEFGIVVDEKSSRANVNVLNDMVKMED